MQHHHQEDRDRGAGRNTPQSEHQESDETLECSEPHTETHHREASGTGKPQKAWTYRRSYINTRQHNQHKPLHGSHTQEKVCCIA